MTTITGSTIIVTDAIAMAISRLVDDAQADDRRDPSHSNLDDLIVRCRLQPGDPNRLGKPVGKAKRVRGVLSHAMENDPEAGGRFVLGLIGMLKGCGAFRSTSPNYVGEHPLQDVISALYAEGFVLSTDGEVRPLLLDNLSGAQMTAALYAYVRRAQRGATDAALVTGTGKDLLEATAKHVLVTRRGVEPTITNFPTILGLAFTELGLATDKSKVTTTRERMDAALYDLGCGVNQLRNQQGTGHGRPFPATVTQTEAREAVEAMGLIAARMLSAL
jgi:hypothetical protein